MSSDRGNWKLKFIDRTLGPVILKVASFFLTARKKPASPKVIGLIKPAAIGDTVLLSGVINDLRLQFPQAKIHLFVGSSNAAFARLLPIVDVVHQLSLKSLGKVIREIRSTQCDWILDFDTWPRISAIWAAFSGAPWKAGFKTPGQHRHYCFDRVVEHRNDIHEYENYQNLLRACGVEPKSLPHGFSNIASDKLMNTIALHLWPGGTKSELKEWPQKSWIQFISEISQLHPLSFILTGGPEDREKNNLFIEALPHDLKKHFENKAGVSFSETIRILKSVVALISVNTGILHLAAAVGTPVLGLHGPTNPRRWGPVGEKNISVLSSHPAAAKLNLGFEYLDSEQVMAELQVREVMSGFKSLSLKNNLGFDL